MDSSPRYDVPSRPGAWIPLKRLLRRVVQPSLPRPAPIPTAGPRYPFAPYPRGWYTVGFSEDVAPGQHRTVQVLGEEWVLWRSVEGRAALTDPICPHLGADLGQGVVDGEALRCPMHAFCFDATGACTRTGYGTRTPPRLRARTLPLVERAGFLFYFHDPDGGDPEWALPEFDAAVEGPSECALFRMGTHVQDIAENTVDIGHFAATHGYQDVTPRAPVAAAPRVLRSSYTLHRSAEIYGSVSERIRVELDVALHGLGLYELRGTTTPGEIRTYFVFAATPVTPDQLDFRVRMWVPEVARPEAMGALFARLPSLPRLWLIRKSVRLAVLVDVQEDAEILNRKRYIPRPGLAQGDGDIGIFRRWARQFYKVDGAGDGDEVST